MAILRNDEIKTLQKAQAYMASHELTEDERQTMADLSAFIEACIEAKRIHSEKTIARVKKYRQTEKGKEVARASSKAYNAKQHAKEKIIASLAAEIVETVPDEKLKKADQIALVKSQLKNDPGAVLGAVEGYPDLIERIKAL